MTARKKFDICINTSTSFCHSTGKCAMGAITTYNSGKVLEYSKPLEDIDSSTDGEIQGIVQSLVHIIDCDEVDTNDKTIVIKSDSIEALNRIRKNLPYWIKRANCKELTLKRQPNKACHTLANETMNKIRDELHWDWRKYET
jgi:hypothetical protein